MTRQSKAARELNRHDDAQGVTTNPNEVGHGGSSPLGGHGQESRTWTQGGPSHGNPASLTDREERSKQADAGVAEEQDEPARHAKDSSTVPVDRTASKKETRKKDRTV